MIHGAPRGAFLLVLLASAAVAQLAGGVGTRPPSTTSITAFDPDQVDLWMTQHDSQQRHGQLESASASVSALDLKAPGPARREYNKGLQLLMRKNFDGAVEHLGKSISVYPQFVSAHNALGSAYLDLGRNDQARDEFARAISLDDHLPYSHLNLGRAELALKNFPAAEQSIQKASSIAPLDLHLLATLTYAQFLNHDYKATILTTNRVHGRKHDGVAIVHYYAAAAWQVQGDLLETRRELETLLLEDPKSPAAEQARQLVEQIQKDQEHPPDPSVVISYRATPSDVPAAPGELPQVFRKTMQDLRQQKQVAEAEAKSPCQACPAPQPPALIEAAVASGPNPRPQRPDRAYAAWTLRTKVDEVALFFAATDHGKAVSDLTPAEVEVHDNRQPPASILSFRNESQLPLRLGLIVDTSASIASRFSFEKAAAANFLHKVVTDTNDLAFVVGFSDSVLLVQDFTADEAQISHGVGQLASAGGTAAWDAVRFAADKLAASGENGQPAAKILVIISDGDDNSSSATLEQAIESAEHGEVIVYTVSTREENSRDTEDPVGDRALKILAERTGGAAFFPGSLNRLDHSLAELQQVIRSRYLISYKPALFQSDGQYRTIDITAQKSGHKIRIYARRGYYARAHASD
jgi:Ca-activated chloride channel family protein